MEPTMKRVNPGISKRRWPGALGLPLALALAFNACQDVDDTVLFGVSEEEASALETEGFGSLLLPLVTPDVVQHRLRDAVFEITRAGVPVVSLNSEVDPDAEQLTANLNPATYQILLSNGWSLERLEAGGGAAAVRAALISQNPVTFSVSNDRVTTVPFTFATTGGTVTFGQGSVSVRIGLIDPASLGSCDVGTQSGCNAGQHCLFSGSGEQTFCATPGDLPVGAPCSSEQCVFGAQCSSVDPAAPEASTCTQLCNPESPPFGCHCRGLDFSDDVGVCGPPPAGVACDLLDQASCPAGQACQYPGGSLGSCGTPGTVAENSSCFGEECEAGLDCFGDDPEFGLPGTCYRFCNLQAPACEFCFDVGTGTVGRCFL